MKLFIKTAILAALMSTPALAETITREVKANHATPVAGLGTYNTQDCSFGPIPQPRVTQAPKHGKVTFKRVLSSLSKGRCKGKQIKSTLVIYTPNRGFRGEDSFKTKYSRAKYVNGAALLYVNDTYNIKVK